MGTRSTSVVYGAREKATLCYGEDRGACASVPAQGQELQEEGRIITM